MAVARERAAASVSDKRLKVTSPTALMVFDAVEICRAYKTQEQIAEEAGFFNRSGQPMTNIIAMFKMGKTRIPIDKIPNIAKAIGLDSFKLFKSAYKEYYPEAWAIIDSAMKDEIGRKVKKALAKN